MCARLLPHRFVGVLASMPIGKYAYCPCIHTQFSITIFHVYSRTSAKVTDTYKRGMCQNVLVNALELINFSYCMHVHACECLAARRTLVNSGTATTWQTRHNLTSTIAIHSTFWLLHATYSVGVTVHFNWLRCVFISLAVCAYWFDFVLIISSKIIK